MTERTLDVSTKRQGLNFLLGTILFLFFFQLLTEFVEAVYLFGLLGSSIPPELGMILLFLSPLFLYAFRGRISPRWINVLATILVIARAVEIALDTRGRMIVSGIGVAAALMYFAGLLSVQRSSDQRLRFASESGAAMALAIVASITFRALHSGSDLSGYGMFRLIAWVLSLGATFLIWRSSPAYEGDSDDVKTRGSRVYAFAFGLTSVIVLIYFAFTAPNVLARWAAVPHISVFAVLLIAWIGVCWWWMRHGDLKPKLLLIWGLIFAAAMTFAILPHQVVFPSSPDGGYPLLEPQISALQILPLYLMLALSPVLMLVFVGYLRGLLAEGPSLNVLAGAFGLAVLYLMVMVLAQVFTTVYDYIPFIGPFFRDEFWLVFLVPSLGAALPALLLPRTGDEPSVFSSRFRKGWLEGAAGLSVVALVGLFALTARPTPPSQAGDTLRVFTYNIRQGYDQFGERNFDGQIDLLRSKAPDIIGLQECDPARIAGGNRKQQMDL